MDYQRLNAEIISSWCRDGWEWGQPITHEVYTKATQGQWGVYLTPTKIVPHEWFGNLNGKKVLGLASGGGQQMPIFAALGAECTVLDYSEKQLEQAEENYLQLQTLYQAGDMMAQAISAAPSPRLP